MTRHLRSSEEDEDIPNELHGRRREQSDGIKRKKWISIHSNVRGE